MRRWRVLLASVVIGGGLLAPPAGAGAAPTLTASHSTAAPGESVTVTVAGCVETPRVEYQVQGQDAATRPELVDNGDGTWSAQVVTTRGDHFFYLVDGCDEFEAADRVDVEDPFLFALPSSTLPLTITGTDCPPGGEPAASVTFGGRTYPVTGLDVNEFGDWVLDVLFRVPVVPTGPTTVEATCGGVTYDALALAPPNRPAPTTQPPDGPPPAPPTTQPPDGPPAPPTTELPSDDPPAPPAVPVSGEPRFTG